MYKLLRRGQIIYKEVFYMYAMRIQINQNDSDPNKTFEQDLTEEMIKEITIALQEAKEGKIISNDHFQDYFCK